MPALSIRRDKSSSALCDDETTTSVKQPGKRDVLDGLKKRVRQTWASKEYDLYAPLYTWHNRLMYDKSKTKKYNETPWGLGFGKSLIDEDGDFHALFLMGFADSHNQFEPYGGYAFIKNHYFGQSKSWSVGTGFVLGLTARHEYDYVPLPLPLPLPLVGVQYKKIALQAAYIPGWRNNGNVLFTWLKHRFE